MHAICNREVASSILVLASIKTSAVMNLSEGSVFSGKIKVLTGVVSKHQVATEGKQTISYEQRVKQILGWMRERL